MAASTALISFTVMAALVQFAVGATLKVEWDLSTNLQAWSSAQSFTTGDSLSFVYASIHSVIEVSKADYDACETSSPVSVFLGGNTIVKLSSPGKRFFICGTPEHCSQGMKVEINTVSAAATAPPLPSVTPPPPASSPPPTTTPPRTPLAPPPAASSPPPAVKYAPPPIKSAPRPSASKAPATAPTKSPLASPPPSSSPSTHTHVAPSVSPSMGTPPSTSAPVPQASAARSLGLPARVAAGIVVGIIGLAL